MATGQSDEIVHVTIHQFKNNISRYLRELEEERYHAVAIRRYDRTIAFCFAHKPNRQKAGPSGPTGG